MEIDENKFRETYERLSKEFPQTLEWAKHKANWEQMPIGAVFVHYKNYIQELMEKESKGVLEW